MSQTNFASVVSLGTYVVPPPFEWENEPRRFTVMPPREKGGTAYDERATDDVCALLSKTHEAREGGKAVRRQVPFKLSSGLAQVI